jgi:vitamin B12/bleomycin/antimicrobial peptide transport system ATP-binding/permease protein
MGGIGTFLRDAWMLARPYFAVSDERWLARGLLAAVIALALTNVGLSVLINFWRGAFYTALGDKDWDSFIALILFYSRNKNGFTFGFTLLAFIHVGVYIYQYYLMQMLEIRWRRWLTDRYLTEWMADRAYYKISLAGSHELGTDNPDQRISEDIRDFCETSLSLTLGLISRVVTLFSFLSILWGLSAAIQFWGIAVPGSLVWIALVYAVVGTICTHLTGRPLAALVFRQQRVEADFRYSLVRVRENVEGIALYRGEQEEQTNLLHRFTAIYGNFRAIMNRTFLLNLVTGTYGQAALIFPFVIVAPGYFAGRFAQGVIFQTIDAFGQVENALSWIVDRYNNLAIWRAVVERLATFHRSIEAARLVDANLIRSEATDNTLRVRGLDLNLPNGTKLLEGADLTITGGHSVVITGRSGSGKSTLFRALSGIWPFARGEIQMPKNVFFLPQRPYIPLGTLRHVITYPTDGTHHDRGELGQLLRDVGLPHLVDRLDRDDNWPQSLSGGELQRIAVARALLAKPDWIFMDEATASLDPESETEIYQLLKRLLPATTLVCIAHGPSVAAFHDGRVVFERSGSTPGVLTAGVLA